MFHETGVSCDLLFSNKNLGEKKTTMFHRIKYPTARPRHTENGGNWGICSKFQLPPCSWTRNKSKIFPPVTSSWNSPNLNLTIKHFSCVSWNLTADVSVVLFSYLASCDFSVLILKLGVLLLPSWLTISQQDFFFSGTKFTSLDTLALQFEGGKIGCFRNNFS